jgi:histidyl-tRNA synthetase
MPKGMRDFLPAEKTRRERVLSCIRKTYNDYGFQEIETPALEDIQRLRSSDGGDNTKMTFDVLKRKLKKTDMDTVADPRDLADLGLRFDLTVPLVRFYEDNKGHLPKVFKSVQIAPVWRAERPQKGRYRQFVQCDIDVIGEEGQLAEIELITVTIATLKALGITDFQIRMNDRKLLTAFLDKVDISPEISKAVFVILDKMDKVSSEVIQLELIALGLSMSQAEAIMQPYTLSSDEDLTKIIDAVNSLAGRTVAVFDPFLIRGMGYYTGTIFEVTSETEGYSLGGGGRYDDMIGRFSNTSVPAVGFSLGFERIVNLAMLPANIEEQQTIALIYEANMDPVLLMQFAEYMVERGFQSRLILKARNTRKQLDDLKAEKFTFFSFVSLTSLAEDIMPRQFG